MAARSFLDRLVVELQILNPLGKSVAVPLMRIVSPTERSRKSSFTAATEVLSKNLITDPIRSSMASIIV
ncbi:MAG: hypothetical protein ACM3MD_00205 [Betaproteobacteria bacterium]